MAIERRTADLPRTGNGHRVALVMSGGGARGAYEAGVLRYLLDDLPHRLGRPVRFDIVTGTSVGAIHACYVAATIGQPAAGLRLAEIWRSLEVSGVYELGAADLVTVPLRLLGLAGGRKHPPEPGIPERLAGLLDPRPLERLVRERIPWTELRRHIDVGAIDAVAVAATEIGSGKSIVWVDNREGVVRRWHAIRSSSPGRPGSSRATRSPRPRSRSCFRRSRSTTAISATAGCA